MDWSSTTRCPSQGGLIYASHLTTVSSPTRRRSTRRALVAGSKAAAHPFHSGAVEGIVNGIDEAGTRASVRNWRSRSARALGGGRQARMPTVAGNLARRVARADLRSGPPGWSSEGHRPRAVRRRLIIDAADISSLTVPRTRRSSRLWSMAHRADRMRNSE